MVGIRYEDNKTLFSVYYLTYFKCLILNLPISILTSVNQINCISLTERLVDKN